MKKIGVLSDTHGYLDTKVFEYLTNCHEIWHAGDFGAIEISDQLSNYKKLKGVYGNMDDELIRQKHPLDQRFECENVNIWMTHIGGYPGKYDKRIRNTLYVNPPDLFICGHSHILKIGRDPKLNNMLHINPGSAGKIGIHKVRTIVRFSIDNHIIKNLEVIELGEKKI